MSEQAASISAPVVKTITFNGKLYFAPFADLLPPLTECERDELQADIETRGVLVPVIVTPEDEVIDGHNRAEIADRLSKAVPIEVKNFGSAAEKRTAALYLNLHRRHVSADEKRRLIREELLVNAGASDRSIGAKVGADNKTVAKERSELERREEIPHVEKRTDTIGRSQPASKKLPIASEGTPTNARDDFIQVEQKPPPATRDRHAAKSPQPPSTPAAPTHTEALGPKFKKCLTELRKLLGELESEKGQAPVQDAAEKNKVPVWVGDKGLRWEWLDGVENTLTELRVKL
ncbi:ParB N-terminal domain-containing protein [Gemmata sp. G18]|uniref:ParB N-terminal domain-containing protein n=1 Tax=Gemmata palustris TaxID=2822762 RepID=A0ABS5BTA0_9BACT|nr:ParB/RepB/Spo0J family partition protein [Gemmata palustris]MBP3956895.1 ParB N-terminal domain-containing protein [Gemmata palustris]